MSLNSQDIEEDLLPDGEKTQSASSIPLLTDWWWDLQDTEGEDRTEFDHELHSYFLSLISSSIDSIRGEPRRLEREKQVCKQRQLQLSFDRFHIFSEADKCLKDVHNTIKSVETAAKSVVSKFPELNERLISFQDEAETLFHTLSQHSSTCDHTAYILDFLEAPSLMESCIRQGMYAQAVEVRAWVLRTSAQSRFANNSIMKIIVDETTALGQSLLDAVLETLSGDVELSQVLTCLNLVRKVGNVNDDGIQKTYLKCRETYLNKQLDSISSSLPAFEYFSSYTEAHRLLFDIVNQFSAMFLPIQIGSSSNSNSSNSRTDSSSSTSLLHIWVFDKIDKYLTTMESVSKRVTEAASISSLLEQAMFLGTSLARVGCDFRPLLPSIFESAIKKLYSTKCEAMKTSYREALMYELQPRMLSMRSSSSSSSTPSHRVSLRSPSMSIALPSSILEFPCLTGLFNRIIMGLNDLRACALLTIKAEIASETVSVCADAIRILHDWVASLDVVDLDSEVLKSFVFSFCSNFDSEFLGAISSAVDHVFGSEVNLCDMSIVHSLVRSTLDILHGGK